MSNNIISSTSSEFFIAGIDGIDYKVEANLRALVTLFRDHKVSEIDASTVVDAKDITRALKIANRPAYFEIVSCSTTDAGNGPVRVYSIRWDAGSYCWRQHGGTRYHTAEEAQAVIDAKDAKDAYKHIRSWGSVVRVN
tara:strand:- start:878 stop:1291 length:414 start_codon:yes stop_codon:yes gene_type:complete